MNTTFVSRFDSRLVAVAQEQSHAQWGEGQPLERRLEKFSAQLKLGGPKLIRACGLVDEKGGVVCAMKRWGLGLTSFEGEAVPAIGVGALFTPEPFRRQGLAERLLEAVFEEARAEGIRAVLLFSDIDPAYYVRLGFRPFPGRDRAGEVALIRQERPFRTRRAAEADLGRLLELYESSWPERGFLRIHRTPASWRLYRLRNVSEPELVFLDRDGRIVGYVSCATATPDAGEKRVGQGSLRVDELVVDERDLPGAWATIRALAEERGLAKVTGWLRAEQVPPRFESHERKDAIPMIKALDPSFRVEAFEAERAHFGANDYF